MIGTIPRFFFLSAFVGIQLLYASETLILRNGGKTEEAEYFVFKDGSFYNQGRFAADREQVQDWWLSSSADNPETAAVTTDLPEDEIKRLKAHRKEGQKFAKDFPGVNGVYIIDDGMFQLTSDDRHIYRYHFVGLILNEDALDWGKITLGFTEGRSRSKILYAKNLTPDNRVFTLNPDDVTVGKAGDKAEFFDPNSRVLSGTVPGVEVGSVIEYAYEYETYAPEDPLIFFPGYYFQMNLPSLSSALEVRVPKDKELYYWEENWDTVPEKKRGFWSRLLNRKKKQEKRAERSSITTEDGKQYTVYEWKRIKMPPIVEEPMMPPVSEVAPQVHATFMKDWDHLDELTGSMQKERIKVTEELKTIVEDLVKDAKTTEDKVARIYHWVQKNIRYISIKSSLSSGWAGHPADETLEKGYGDCTDKSVLLCSMLKVIGIEAEPIVLRTNDKGKFDPEYPVLACNHCITKVHLAERSIYLDTTTQDHRYPSLRADDHGVLAINFMRREREHVPIPEGAEADGKIAKEKMKLYEDGTLFITSSNRYQGRYEAGLRGGWKQVPEQMRRRIMQQYLNGLAPGAMLEEFTMPDPQDLSAPFYLDYTYRLNNYLQQAKDLRIMPIPDREMNFPEAGLASRRYPIAYTTAKALERNLEIQVPEKLTTVSVPETIEINNQHVHYSESFSVKNGIIKGKIRFERFSVRVSPEDYPEYRRALQKIEQITKRPIYLEVKK